ncbi:MAG: hypothetical protein LQ339_004482 [Xanthoria mediterranea]|nr:MAG: hypothetical protein LQ339_004482 [Xanthoria mediterranea]
MMRKLTILPTLRPTLSNSSRVWSCAAARLFYQSHRTPSITTATSRPLIFPQSALFGAPSHCRTIFIQTENTPNVDALKFLPNRQILPKVLSSPFIEYLNPRSTLAPPYPSPLAARLLGVDGVSAVFYGPDFITITKAADANWAHVKPEVFSLITEVLNSGERIVTEIDKGAYTAGQEDGGAQNSLAYNEGDSEVVGMIKELLETRIRPAIQDDGGDVDFCGFENGKVLLKLRGACRTCDSSTVTLRNGIESMLMHYIEEVQGVTQVVDEAELTSNEEFARFEEKLKERKGTRTATA